MLKSVLCAVRLVQPRLAALRASHLLSGQSRALPALASGKHHTPAHLRWYSSAGSAEVTLTDDARSLNGLITRFADLGSIGVHEALVESITHGMKYEKMTPVQSQTINAALSGKDIVAQAKTGTGKTLAFLLPIISRILTNDPSLAQRTPRRSNDMYARRSSRVPLDIRAIVMSPTRELAEQIGEEAKKLVNRTGVIVQTAVGGTGKRYMLEQTHRQGCHLLVATPGRLLDLLQDPSSGIAAPKLQALCLDEADRMLDVGFGRELEQIAKYLPARHEQPRQVLLYSATIPKNVVTVARQYIDPRNFEFVQTVSKDDVPTHERVAQHIVVCSGLENLAPTLLELCDREIQKARSDPESMPFKAIVFLGTTATVEVFSDIMWGAKQTMELPQLFHIQSKLNQQQRQRAADMFKRSRSGILISSDVTARGMDFPNVTHVIQINGPPDQEQYIHRVGRTGRAGKEGQGWILVGDVELPTVRDKLAGLPIKKVSDLASAEFNAPGTAGSRPKYFDIAEAAARRIDSGTMSNAYRSLIGGTMRDVDKRTLVPALNRLVTVGWGMDEPPALSPKLVQQMGLGRIPGVRVASRSYEEGLSGWSNRFGRNEGFRGNDKFRGNDGFGETDRSRGTDRFGGSDRSRGIDRSGGNNRSSNNRWSHGPSQSRSAPRWY